MKRNKLVNQFLENHSEILESSFPGSNFFSSIKQKIQNKFSKTPPFQRRDITALKGKTMGAVRERMSQYRKDNYNPPKESYMDSLRQNLSSLKGKAMGAVRERMSQYRKNNYNPPKENNYNHGETLRRRAGKFAMAKSTNNNRNTPTPQQNNYNHGDALRRRAGKFAMARSALK